MGGIFALAHAARLATVVEPQTLIQGYYLAGLLVWAGLSVVFFLAQPRPTKAMHGTIAAGAVVLLALALLLIVNTNVSPVSADVLYKQGLRYDGQSSWDNAIYYYREAIKSAPQEDYYYLFWGRAMMERGKLETSAQGRDVYFQTAFDALVEAKRLSPLNTDHTANMGRLVSHLGRTRYGCRCTPGKAEPRTGVVRRSRGISLRAMHSSTMSGAWSTFSSATWTRHSSSMKSRWPWTRSSRRPTCSWATST